MIKFGIIGCGWIVEKAYLPILNSLDNVCVYAIFDIDIGKLTLLKEKYKIPIVSNEINSFLELPIDAVVIATPNNMHSFYTNYSLQYGKHVLCEKPVAFSKSEIEKTIAIANSNDKVFFPALVNRFRKEIMYLRKRVKEIGMIKNVKVSWVRRSGIPKLGSWITSKHYAGGGALIDIGTHIIDIGLMFTEKTDIKIIEAQFGIIEDIEKYQASWNQSQIKNPLLVDIETYSRGKILMDDASIEYYVDWCADVVEDTTHIELCGERGKISLRTLFGFSKNYVHDNIEFSMEKNGSIKETKVWPMNNSYARDAFKTLIISFIDSINGTNNSFLKTSDAISAVEVIEMLYREQGDKSYVHRV